MRKRDSSYWGYWKQMVKASVARNTVELPTFLSLTDFSGKTVLDAGSGIGRIALKTAKRAKKVYAVDESAAALKELKKKIIEKRLHKKILARKGSLYNLPFKENFFDISYALWVLHDRKHGWKRILEELARVTKPGGCTIVCFSSEKGSIPRLEAITRKGELKKRKEFVLQVTKHLKKLCGNSHKKTAMLPFYFKNPENAFEILKHTFLPRNIGKQKQQKCMRFLKKHSSKKGCFLEEEVVFCYAFKTRTSKV